METAICILFVPSLQLSTLCFINTLFLSSERKKNDQFCLPGIFNISLQQKQNFVNSCFILRRVRKILPGVNLGLECYLAKVAITINWFLCIWQMSVIMGTNTSLPLHESLHQATALALWRIGFFLGNFSTYKH
ncbi:hypothetical protein CIPAW_03G281800 [Carya illinoinensis]|uniref:Uncharacterized protein n=1 Tax=Carya illinoinensis TaxID=32201 RepID=A0A8T1RA91_CARIL|nr:hypothetical protein CIPAW_03G281800 [Carya illinoinensis]